MPFNKTYTDLPLWAARDDGQGYFIFGTTIKGADVQLMALPLGFVDPELAAAEEARRQEQGDGGAAAGGGQQQPPPQGEPGPGVSTASQAEPPVQPATEPPAVAPPPVAPPEQQPEQQPQGEQPQGEQPPTA